MIFILFTLFFASSSPAQMTGLARSEFIRSDERACAYARFLTSYLDELSDEELKTEVEEQSRRYQEFSESGEEPLTRSEIKLRKKIARDFQILATGGQSRPMLKKMASSLCMAGRAMGSAALHEIGIAGSVITSALTFPVRLVAKFGAGIVKRRSEHQRGVSYSEFTGTKWSANLVSILFQTYKVAFASVNPLMLAVYGVTAMDMALQEHCRSGRPISDRSARFCKTYENLKTGEYARFWMILIKSRNSRSSFDNFEKLFIKFYYFNGRKGLEFVELPDQSSQGTIFSLAIGLAEVESRHENIFARAFCFWPGIRPCPTSL